MLLTRIKVIGDSMKPTLKENQIVVASSIPFIFNKPKVGDLVVLRRERLMIKRIAKIEGEKFFVIGDNKDKSSDSRNFGWVERARILGKIIFVS